MIDQFTHESQSSTAPTTTTRRVPVTEWLSRRHTSLKSRDDIELERKAQEPKSLLVLETDKTKDPELDPFQLSEQRRESFVAFFKHRHCTYDTANPPNEIFVRNPDLPSSHPKIEVPLYFEEYLGNQHEARQAITRSLQGEIIDLLGESKKYDLSTLDDFTQWLKDLHSISVHGISGEDYYRSDVTPGEFHNKSSLQNNYDKEFQVVRRWAKLLEDPFGDRQHTFNEVVLNLPGISDKGQPRTGFTTHYYPGHEYHAEYLLQMHLAFIEAQKSSDKVSCVEHIAKFMQYAANSHLFEQVNFSLFMNIANVVLEQHDISGISHDHIDYAAMTLKPGNFVRFFMAKITENLYEKERQVAPTKKTEQIESPSSLIPKTIQLVDGSEIEVTTHMVGSLEQSLTSPMVIPILTKNLHSTWSDNQQHTRWVSDLANTYIIFDHALTAEDIEYLAHLNRYNPYHGYLGVTEDNKYVFKTDRSYKDYNDVQSELPLTSSEILESMVGLRQLQLDQSDVLGIQDEGNPGELIVNYFPLTERKISIGSTRKPKKSARRAKAMRAEILSLAKRLYKENGIELEDIPVQKEQLLSHGARGMIFKHMRAGDETIIKTFPLLRPDDLYQLFVMDKYCKDHQMQGFPRFYRLCIVNGTLAAEMEFIPNLIPANKVVDMLPDETIEQAVQSITAFLELTHLSHGDIHEENIQIQIIAGENGNKEYKVWILDPCGVYGESNRLIDWDEISQVRDILNTCNVRNWQANQDSVTT